MTGATYKLGEEGEPESVWRFPLHGGSHARIAKILDTDTETQAALTALAADSTNSTLRDTVIQTINRRTGNLIGLLLVRQFFGQDVDLNPDNDELSLWKALKPGTAEDIAEAIEGKAEVHTALAGGDKQTIVRLISRMTGRAAGQEANREVGGGVVTLVRKLIHV